MNAMEEVSPGKQLGRLEILAEIRAGGHGRLFRALDTRAQHEVGVLVFPLRSGVEFRFEKKHSQAAGLKHRNILSVQRLLSRPGVSYLITEQITGESLHAILKRGAVPIRTLLNIGMQIAGGLAAGHAAGIVHGDLTPDNVMVGEDETVKLLDFGFARQVGEDPVEYMSPEQVRGEPADARSDIFSLGSILYEMATGREAFGGHTPADRLRAILELTPQEPHAGVPAELAGVIGRCLDKHPEDRFQSASEVRDALQSCAELPGLPARAKPPGRRWRRPKIAWRAPLWLTAVLAVLTALLLGIVLLKWPVLWSNPPKFQRLTFRQGSILRARFSADGKRIAYTARFNGSPLASYVTTPGGGDGRDLGLPEGSSIAALSSRDEVAFRMKNGVLARTPLNGGAQEEVADLVLDADWSPSGDKLAAARHSGPDGRYRIEYPIGRVVYESEAQLDLVRVSPDGKRVAFSSVEREGRRLWVTQESGEPKTLGGFAKGEGMNTLCWSADGKEIWFGSVAPQESGLIQGIGLNGKKRRVTWMPGGSLDDVARDGRTLIENIRVLSGIGFTDLGSNSERDLSWHAQTLNVHISSDGKNLIFTEYGERGGPNFGIYSRATDGSAATWIGEGQAVAVSPDRKWVSAFQAGATPPYSLLSVGFFKTNPISIAGLENGSAAVVGWLADGTYLVWGRELGKNPRHFRWNSTTKALKPITPEGSTAGFISGNGTQILSAGIDNRPYVFYADGGQRQPAKGLEPGYLTLGWANDGESVLVAAIDGGDRRFAISRIDLSTGANTLVGKLRPSIEADTVIPRAITPDGKFLAFTYYRTEGELYLAEGLK